MDEANIPFSAVRTPSDLFDDPQLNAFGRALAVRMPKGNVANLPGLPFCIDDDAPALRMQPPAAGEHTDAILAALGYSAERMAELRQKGDKLKHHPRRKNAVPNFVWLSPAADEPICAHASHHHLSMHMRMQPAEVVIGPRLLERVGRTCRRYPTDATSPSASGQTMLCGMSS